MKNSINSNNDFISSKDNNDKEHVMHSKSDNIEIMNSDVTYEIIGKLFNSGSEFNAQHLSSQNMN